MKNISSSTQRVKLNLVKCTLFFIGFSIFLNCKKTKNGEINLTNEKVIEALKVNKSNDTTKEFEFDYDSFSSYLNKTFKNQFKVNIDTLNIKMIPEDIRDISIWADLINKSNKLIEYSFISRNRTIDVYILSNINTEETEKCYEYIEGLAFNKKNDIHKGPGLSYENDYVFMLKNNIVWLNTPCLVSYKNHLLISKYLKDIIVSESELIDKEIYCKCGKVICEK